ncbi:MAG: hypothetical protein JSR90_22545 [Proteobacteria bacterium]|nr:hypothetical protein [Pseudomonadota bacterium]
MKTLVAASLLTLCFHGIAQGQTVPLIPDSGSGGPSLIACSYNAAGSYTGADSANPGESAGGPVRTDDGWRQVIDGADGRSCPRQVRR